MATYKVKYHGFMYIEAECEEEAFEKAENDEDIYNELKWDSAEKFDGFDNENGIILRRICGARA